MSSQPQSILAIDPGKQGAFALLSADGLRYRIWKMPLVGDVITAHSISSVYKEIAALCKSPPLVVVERIFTMPTDACSQKDYDAAREYLAHTKWAIDNGESLRTEVPQLPEVRMDGRVGNLRYAIGYGYLSMCALLGWSITTVTPRTWMSVIYKNVPGHLESKDRSRAYVQQRWPELYQKGSPIWPERAKKPLDGACDALCIAEYGRLNHQSFPQNTK
jgi:hypothetical protein